MTHLRRPRHEGHGSGGVLVITLAFDVYGKLIDTHGLVAQVFEPGEDPDLTVGSIGGPAGALEESLRERTMGKGGCEE